MHNAVLGNLALVPVRNANAAGHWAKAVGVPGQHAAAEAPGQHAAAGVPGQHAAAGPGGTGQPALSLAADLSRWLACLPSERQTKRGVCRDRPRQPGPADR
jgi:hypothetical protein